MRKLGTFLTAWLCLLLPAQLVTAIEILPPGHRPTPLGVHALTEAKIVIRPGQELERGTILMRDGRIVAVGTQLAVPADARRWQLAGHTIYPGFIDVHLPGTGTNRPVATGSSEPVSSRDRGLTSRSLRFYGVPGDELDPGQTGAGPEVRGVAPEHRVATQFSPSDKLLEEMHALGFTVANVVPGRGLFRGSSATFLLANRDPNEILLQADTFQHVAFEMGEREAGYPASLMGAIAVIRQTLLDAGFYQADRSHFEKHPNDRERPAFNPALEALAPILTRRRSIVFEPGSVLMNHRATHLARESNLRFLLVSCGQEWRRPEIARNTGAGFIVPLDFPEIPKLPHEDDWEQVSLDQLRAWDWAPENPLLLRQSGVEIAFTTYGLSERKQFRKKLRAALDRGLTEADAVAALTIVPARFCGLDALLGTIEPGKLANLTVVAGPTYFDPKNKVQSVWIEGRPYPVRSAPPPEGRESERPKEEGAPTNQPPSILVQTNAPGSRTNLLVGTGANETANGSAAQKRRIARDPQADRGPYAQPPAVLVRGATIWTCGPAGVLSNASLLAVGGKIRAVGNPIEIPPELGTNLWVIDAAGKHLTPGIVDPHSHSMILGAVNEATLPSTAMVRIADVANSETANIQRQLAGGVTVVNLLHGSANPIGGQNCIIKLRDGVLPEQLLLAGAPPGIKFALGENVKQANWGDRYVTRFPQTRMGVPTFIANRFVAAREYAQRKKTASANSRPLRVDLELEAIAEILAGERWIHCHSYRQDEILAFLRLMEQFGVRVGTLQHVLEGYKVADEIAAHGAGASCFSDWWGYKFEVYDAIPYAGSLMRDRQVLVSFNSDSSDLARRLNLEAAKAVKYGGTPETAALQFVTLNPAKQLRIDRHVGSLEPGKDADFVLWSKEPLDSAGTCLETWIDGKKYFDRQLDAERAQARTRERADLLARAKASWRATREQPEDTAGQETFFRVALEFQHEHELISCSEDE